MNIVITDMKTVVNDDINITFLHRFGNIFAYPLTDYENIADVVENADIILCNKTELNEYTLRKAKKLKYIGLFATGYNNIDIEYCKKNNITVCNAGVYSGNAIAQQVFAFLLNHYSKICKYDDFVQQGGWTNSDTFSPFKFKTHELCGKTIGIVGFGHTGKSVAKIANAFDMNIITYSRTKINLDYVKFTDFDTLLHESDIVTIHCPLTASTKNLFNEESFNKMKKGSYLVNTARGAIVDETALVNAVKSNHLSGAGIDVLDIEPMNSDCKLLNVENICITPHVAWASIETRKRLLKIVEENISNFLNGTPQNVVKSE